MIHNLERAIDQLTEITGLPLLLKDEGGFCQLSLRHDDGLKTIITTMGSSQDELIEKIQFYLEISELIEEKQQEIPA